MFPFGGNINEEIAALKRDMAALQSMIQGNTRAMNDLGHALRELSKEVKLLRGKIK